MPLPRQLDPFFVAQGSQPIAVGAPHHGTGRNVQADRATGPIAQALAKQLHARVVVVSDLRRTADVNKNPVGMPGGARKHALRYQNEIFRDLPRLIIEIHGHVSGRYPVELTSGFDLDPACPGDAIFLERLRRIKQSLPVLLASKIGQSSNVGVYPLDPDVRNTATNTYTFQKIRRARNRLGMEWYGLHVELAADLRTGEHAQAPGYVDAMAEAFAGAIQIAFDPLPGAEATFRAHADPAGEEPVSGMALRVVKAPEDSAGKNIALLHPKKASTLGFLDGDLISLYYRGERLRVPVFASPVVSPQQIAVPARLRRQLDLKSGDLVTVIQPASAHGATMAKNYRPFVVRETRLATSRQVWMHPAVLQRMQAEPRSRHRSRGLLSSSEPALVQLIPDGSLMERVVAASDVLMQKLTLSIGDVVMIEAKV